MSRIVFPRTFSRQSIDHSLSETGLAKHTADRSELDIVPIGSDRSVLVLFEDEYACRHHLRTLNDHTSRSSKCVHVVGVDGLPRVVSAVGLTHGGFGELCS